MTRLGRCRDASLVAVVSLLLSGCGAARMLGWTTSIGDLGGQCSLIEGFGGGTEDIALDPLSGGFYVSADPRRGEGGQGGIWLVKPTGDGDFVKIEVSDGVPARLHPHGIAVWEDADRREHRLFAINHAPPSSKGEVWGDSSVETYRINDDSSLTYLGGQAFPKLLPRPNDLVAVGRDAYYAVNDHGSSRARNPGNPFAAENREKLLLQRKASIVFVRGAQGQPAASGLAFPAGIATSENLQTLYVGEVSAGEISVWSRSADDTLTKVAAHPAGPMPDNLTRVGDRLWYGAHSRLLRFLWRAKSAKAASPGRVEVMDPITGDHRPVFRDDGLDGVSTISVGVPWRDSVLVGSIDQHAVGVCPLAAR